jgi:hypothetical protein
LIACIESREKCDIQSYTFIHENEPIERNRLLNNVGAPLLSSAGSYKKEIDSYLEAVYD